MKMIQFSSKAKLFLSTMLLLLTLALAQFAIPIEFLSSTCGGSGYIMNGSASESNLKVVLRSLVENVNKTAFYTSSHGENGEVVYGLAQCRGDLNASPCGACVSYAKKSLTERCRGNSSGSIHLGGCFLRYGTHNFYSKLDTSFSAVACGNSTNSTDANARGSVGSIAPLLMKVVRFTAFRDVGFYTLKDDGIYALAQCWRDLSQDQCMQCLGTTVYKGLVQCPEGSMQGYGLQMNCMILYARHKFYGDAGLLSPTLTSPDIKLPLIMMGLIIGGFTILMAVVGVIVFWKREVKYGHRYEKPPLQGCFSGEGTEIPIEKNSIRQDAS